jgi:cellulose synthase/poly-beta-1,6-N-acetylglucosamine synthase-like glycosyltransferase
VYQVSRLGYHVRRLRHRPEPLDAIVDRTWDEAEPIAILVPSYKEDARTIRQTLLSAALQHHPSARVALLLDDPPEPSGRESARMLADAMAIPAEIEAMLAEPRRIVSRGLDAMREQPVARRNARAELKRLLEVYGELIGWLERQARVTPIDDHTDAHFVALSYDAHRDLLERRARTLAEGLAQPGQVTLAAIEREYGRLLDVFGTEIAVFQRKRYRNVSHEPNKAANLNAYIDVMGRRVAEVRRHDGLHLESRDGDDAIAIPDATYILTLDADSMLAPDYALRLAAELAAPGNERVAVVQTPYSAIPRASGVLERVAGATTDIQYIVHQGFTWCRATFWVGANALLRKSALEDIRTEHHEGELTVPKYIQDRTVIEDTESTIDLAERGWELLNYPERLAFSATPPDFGSLLIQRTRWANGGLLILPNLIRHLLSTPVRAMTVPSFLVRLHYLSSIATGSVGLMLLLFLPLGVEMNSPWLPLTALPYFLLYWRDLVRIGYRRSDILRVYALNLLLIPVNLAGVLKSLQQGLTGRRVPFGRTPKVTGRTVAPNWAALSLWGLLAWCLIAAGFDVAAGRWVHAGFALMTGTALGYALVAFVGLQASVEDATRGWSLVPRALPARGRTVTVGNGRPR